MRTDHRGNLPFTFSLSLNQSISFSCGTRIEINGEKMVVVQIKSIKSHKNSLEITGMCRKVNKKPAD